MENNVKSKVEINTNNELDLLKAKYGTVYTVTFAINDDETEFATIYIRKMDRETYTNVQKVLQKDSIQAIELLIKKLYVGGDDINKALGDFDVLRSLETPISNLFNTRTADIKKN